jgi:uncharacterized membrane protein YfcA
MKLDALKFAALTVSAFAAGVMNAIAGGGTILTFPALIFAGESALVANATSTVALLPAAAASMWGYRREVVIYRQWLSTLLLPSLFGGLVGSILVLATPEKTFAKLAPLLILFATLLFVLQSAVGRYVAGPRSDLAPRGRLIGVWVFQFGIAVYGGYFGAGIGILMLAALGFLGLSDIHAMNGLKNFFAICINLVAAAYFVSRGYVDWPIAGAMTVASIAGGYGGARLARGIGREKARVAVIIIGLAVAALLLVRQEFF